MWMPVCHRNPLNGPTGPLGHAKRFVLNQQKLKLTLTPFQPGKRQANFGQFIGKGRAAHPFLLCFGRWPSDCAELVKPLCNPWSLCDAVLHFSFHPSKGPAYA
jgi:hypothetical protein